jgi:hypothetical protein
MRRTRASIMQNIDAEVAMKIAESRGISDMDGLRLLVRSQTHQMMEDDDLKMWHFSALALFDMWETEIATGDPRNSIYLRGDEIAR